MVTAAEPPIHVRSLIVANFQLAAQYRVQSVLWLLFAVIRPVVFLAAWSAAANAQGGSIGDFSIGDFAADYVCLTLVGQLTMSWNAYDFEIEIRQGKLSPKCDPCIRCTTRSSRTSSGR